MKIKPLNYPFFTEAARILNARQSRSIFLCGNVHDLFYLPEEDGPGDYVPLVNFLTAKWAVKGLILLVYELNGPIRFMNDADREKLKKAWVAWRSGMDADQLAVQGMFDGAKQAAQEATEREFETDLRDAIGNPTVALEVLRQFSLCSRSKTSGGKPVLTEDLLIIIDAADMLLPEGGSIASLSPTDRHRVGITQDWFSDPGFINGGDSVVLIAESRSLIHERIAKLPQALAIEVPSPDAEARKHYISWFSQQQPQGRPLRLWGSQSDLAQFTAGLSIHALRQLLVRACYSGETVSPQDVIDKVEEFIQNQLGEDVVEFKKPTQTIEDLVGCSRLKAFLREELIPRFKSSGADALPGAAVCGPIGGGKTYIFEAVAGALDLPVLVLKNIRSQWFGQTDVIFERLKRVLEALVKAVIFVDEADTQFGGVGAEAHATERRLTGKIQAMMSDPKLRGRIIWLLMTARIHLLSPDMRRPGRVGDLIIPVLDPEDDDRKEFLRWVLKPVLEKTPTDKEIKQLDELTQDYSSASFASLRSQLLAKAADGALSMDAIRDIVNDHIPPAIGLTRRYQTLQALVNCTRRSLLPDPSVSEKDREKWAAEIRELEATGIR